MNDSVHYDLEKKEEPIAWVSIPFHKTDENELFVRILKDFAADHGIPESRWRAISYSPTPQFKSVPLYQSGNVIISSFCVLTPEDAYGLSRMSVLRRDFAPEDFKRLADDFRDRFKQAFGDRVQYTFEDDRQ